MNMSNFIITSEMGRVKLQIKKIENITNRQVTFSKRRNGLIKKAYELSVLCDVDVGLLMFSPSGRATAFSGKNNRSIEEVLARYVNLPEHERGRRLQNQEHLQSTLSKMKREADRSQQPTSIPVSTEIQTEEIQQEILRCKIQLEAVEKRLRIFEGDPTEITTLSEAQYREHILEETLKSISQRKHSLEENYDISNKQSSSQDNINGIVARDPNHSLDWLPTRDPQVQIMNFLDSNGLLPLREHRNGVDNLQLPATVFVQAPHIQVDDQTSPSSEMKDDDNTQQANLVQPMEVNHTPWSEIYQIGNRDIIAAQQRDGTLLELFLSQITP